MSNEENDLVDRINKLTVTAESDLASLNSQLASHKSTNPLTMNTPKTMTYFSDNQIKELKKIITETVSGILTPESTTDSVDERIDFSQNISDSEKIPDIVKTLREFAGKPGEFNSWRKAVERILTLYAQYRGTPKYFSILHAIRHKIIGEADAALEAYRTPLEWSAIRRCLVLHYSDKRDISTLEYQMSILTQRNLTVTEYYQRVYRHLSLILDKIDCLEIGEESLGILTKTYREKALDTFIRGLNGNLPSLVSVTSPTSLPQALHTCLKLGNLGGRNSQYPDDKGHRNTGQTRQTRTSQFYPELTYSSREHARPPVMHGQPSGRNTTADNRPPLPPKPTTPMEVDQSLQTRQVDYQNRQRQNQSYSGGQTIHKRQLSSNTHQPQKYQRVFNTEAVVHQEPDPLEELETQEDGTYQDDHDEDNNVEEQEYTDEINFLD